jgi:lipid II:glycine glycyltransferase (peptidoglycan interpeptide bridge formation enzyme)
LTDGIKERFREAFALICDPPIDTSEELENLGFLPLASGGFGGIQPKAIMEVDLRNRSPDDLLSAFAQKWRYNVRLSGRKGVKVRSGSARDLEVFYGLLTETSKRDEFPIRSFDYYASVWDSLEPSSMAKMLVAENSGTAIAAVVLGAFGHRVSYLYGASSNADRNLMPNHLLHYEAIKWSSESGYWTYDLQGVSPLKNGEPTDESSAGLNRFKAGFGASYVEYVGELDLPLRPNWYRAWRKLYPTAAKVLRKVRTGL